MFQVRGKAISLLTDIILLSRTCKYQYTRIMENDAACHQNGGQLDEHRFYA